jgi:hypothetical protein
VEARFTEAELERTRVKSEEETEERRKFMEWISDFDTEIDFVRAIKQRYPGTGVRLLENHNFNTWIE